jgi:voltage-gated potassium channel Kch
MFQLQSSPLIINKNKIGLILLIIVCYVAFLMQFDMSHFTHIQVNAVQNDNTFFEKVGNRLYFTLVTLSTVGYGDMVPQTFRLRMYNTAFIFLVILIGLCA